MERIRSAAYAIAMAAVLLAASAGLAKAHSFLVDSTPAAKEHVAPPVKGVKLVFGGGVEASYSKISIEDADGKIVAEGGRSGADDKVMELELPGVANPGEYKVRYRVLSKDGHVVQGRYEFFVDKP